MRRLIPGDAAAVAGLIRRAFGAIAVPIRPPPSALQVTAADIVVHLGSGGGGVIVDPAAACLLWTPGQGGFHLSRLAVAPEHRGRGLAASLLAAAEDEARRTGRTRLTLSARLALEGNRRLFAKAGFVERARHAHAGFDQATYVDMEKAVAAAGLRVQTSGRTA